MILFESIAAYRVSCAVDIDGAAALDIFEDDRAAAVNRKREFVACERVAVGDCVGTRVRYVDEGIITCSTCKGIVARVAVNRNICAAVVDVIISFAAVENGVIAANDNGIVAFACVD